MNRSVRAVRRRAWLGAATARRTELPELTPRLRPGVPVARASTRPGIGRGAAPPIGL